MPSFKAWGYQTRAADRSNYSDPHVYHGTLERHGISMALRVDCGSRIVLYNRLLYGAVLLTTVYPWIVVKNYTLRLRSLVLYGGQSYRTILFTFAWVFQARPLYIVVFYAGVWAISKVALTSPMKRQVDPINMLRDMRHGVSIGSYWPLPPIIFL